MSGADDNLRVMTGTKAAKLPEPQRTQFLSGVGLGLAIGGFQKLAWLLSVAVLLCSLGAVVGMQMAMADLRADMAERERDLLDREMTGVLVMEEAIARAQHDAQLLRDARRWAEANAERIAERAERVAPTEMGAAMARKGRRK